MEFFWQLGEEEKTRGSQGYVEEGDQHWDAAAISGVGFGTELLAEETFFETCFDPKPYNNEKRADECVEVIFQNGDGHGRKNDARVNGMADDPVWAGFDDAVFVFSRDKGGPEFPQMESCPPGQPKSDSGKKRQDPPCPLRYRNEMTIGPTKSEQKDEARSSDETVR